MRKRFCFLILSGLLGILQIHAQWTKQDSIKLQHFLSGDDELKLNDNAVNSIRFGLPKEQMPSFQPQMSLDNPALHFKEELPDIFTDSLAKYKEYLTLRPYNIFTQYGEDPIHAPANCFSRSWAGKVYPFTSDPFDPRSQRVSAGKHSDSPAGFGIGYSFSMEDVLQYLFSKKGRARMRNAKNANAWKTY